MHHSLTKRSPSNLSLLLLCPGMAISRGRSSKNRLLRNISACSNERPLSRIRLFASKADFRLLSSRAPICHPCRGFGSSRLFGICPDSFEVLKRATPVEDSARPAQPSFSFASFQGSNLRPLSRIRPFRSNAHHHRSKTFTRCPPDAPRCAHEAVTAPRLAASTAREPP